MAFDMMDGICMLRDPGTGKDVQMRIGCHSGTVVAGVVGLKMPRLVESSQCQIMILTDFNREKTVVKKQMQCSFD